MFHAVTGFTLLAEPHRQADRAALAIARTWTAFDPWFALGLIASKAERLLVHERALLYWPLFRAGVLPEPERGFFANHRAAIEELADDFWLAVLALALVGAGLAYARRQRLALCLLPFAGVTAALYSTIFAEPRYRLPICMLLLPLGALALDWLWQTGRALVRSNAAAGWRREAAIGFGLAAAVILAGYAASLIGRHLREGHRWAVHTCRVGEEPRFCSWRTLEASALGGRPAVSGVWNGVGIAVPSGELDRPAAVAVETELAAAAGEYTLRANIDRARVPAENATLMLWAGDRPLALLPLDELPEEPIAWQTSVHHGGGHLRLRARVERQAGVSAPARVWISSLWLEAAGAI
jgi:hypothetical protein